MTNEELLAAEEKVMGAVCDLCRWPLAYRDEEIMYAEKCNYCPAADAVQTALKSAYKEAACDQI